MKAILLLFVKPYTGGGEKFRRIRLSRPQKDLGDNKRFAKYAVQQRHRRRGCVEASQPIFHERKAQTAAYDSGQILRQRQVRFSDRSSLNGQSKNARQRYPPRQHDRRSPAGNQENQWKRQFQLPRLRNLGRAVQRSK